MSPTLLPLRVRPFAARRIASLRLPYQRHGQHVPAPRQRVSAASVDPLTAMAQQLLEKEEQLRAMFEPGKKMPRAAVVAKLRKEIGELRDSLAGAAKTGALPRETAPGAAASLPAAAAASVEASELVVDAGMNRAQQILMEVEAKLKVQQIDELDLYEGSQHPQHSASRRSVELARLESENNRLRKRAHALLSHQAVLEDLYREYFGQDWVPKAEALQQPQLQVSSATVLSFGMSTGDVEPHTYATPNIDGSMDYGAEEDAHGSMDYAVEESEAYAQAVEAVAEYESPELEADELTFSLGLEDDEQLATSSGSWAVSETVTSVRV